LARSKEAREIKIKKKCKDKKEIVKIKKKRRAKA
jgi:hypothetical protein